MSATAASRDLLWEIRRATGRKALEIVKGERLDEEGLVVDGADWYVLSKDRDQYLMGWGRTKVKAIEHAHSQMVQQP